MRNSLLIAAMIFVGLSCFAGVSVSSPGSGSTVGSPVHFVASASSSYSSIASMIIYVDGNKMYTKYASSLDTYISLGGGSHYVVTKAWDNQGHVFQDSRSITVSGTSTSTSTVGVTVSSPSSGSTVGSPTTFSATAKGNAAISAMALYVDGHDTALVYSSSLSKSVSLGSGSHTATFRAWDVNGTKYDKIVNFSVSGSTTTSGSTGSTSTSNGTTIYDIESMSGWQSCSACAGNVSGTGPVAGYSMEQHQSSPSMDGSSTKYSIWGDKAWANVLWYKSLSSIMGSKTASATHFIYDMYYYIKTPNAAQAIEFDINQFVGGKSLIFGTQCNLLNGHQWDTWNNTQNKWVHSGKYCGTPTANTWHHVVVEVARDPSNNWLHYISITHDGTKNYLDIWDAPASTSWTGVTVNFQLDGDYQLTDYSVWVDKFKFIYW